MSRKNIVHVGYVGLGTVSVTFKEHHRTTFRTYYFSGPQAIAFLTGSDPQDLNGQEGGTPANAMHQFMANLGTLAGGEASEAIAGALGEEELVSTSAAILAML